MGLVSADRGLLVRERIVRPVLAVLRVSDFMTLYTDGAPEAAADETGPGSGR